jgi:hypothetical protein
MSFIKFHSPIGNTTLLVFAMCMICNLTLAQSTTTKATNQSSELSCKLSSKQLMKRKETVLKNLKNEILETRELSNGYSFKFAGNDKVLDQLHEFIKTERTCCDFFIFGLSISGDTSEAWLELTGPEGAKNFISEELGLVSSQ